LILRDVIYISQSHYDQGILKAPAADSERQPRYAEIRQYSYRDYMDKFVLPYYLSSRKKTYTRKQLLEEANLDCVIQWLKDNKKVWVHANENDFLIRPEDIEWFKAAFGKQFILFSGGGHLGNLYKPDVQDRIMASLAGLQ
jgi:hypothetical protein